MADPANRRLSAVPEEAPSVRPGQVWQDNSVRGESGPFRVISVDSGFAHCRGGHDGEGAARRVALTRFDGRPRGGIVLVSDAEDATDLVQRRVLTALWQLDYSGVPRRLSSLADVLGGFYTAEEIRAALDAAEAEGLVVEVAAGDDEWALTGGGRRLAAVG